jgi:hypothetical protein
MTHIENMKIGKLFNTLSFEEYFELIENHKKYTDFNTLGLFRSIIENNNLSVDQKIEVKNSAIKMFEKTFNFLQVKDPFTYFGIERLGKDLTKGDEEQAWKQIVHNQEKILKDKRIKHRSFGIYSKHHCAEINCIYNGLMLHKGSFLTVDRMHFASDQNRYEKKEKAKKIKSVRKIESQIVKDEIDLETAPAGNSLQIS